MGLHLMGMHLIGMHLMGIHLMGHASYRHTSYRHTSYGHASHGRASHKHVSHRRVSLIDIYRTRIEAFRFFGLAFGETGPRSAVSQMSQWPTAKVNRLVLGEPGANFCHLGALEGDWPNPHLGGAEGLPGTIALGYRLAMHLS